MGGNLTEYFQSAMYSLLRKKEKHRKSEDRVRTGIFGTTCSWHTSFHWHRRVSDSNFKGQQASHLHRCQAEQLAMFLAKESSYKRKKKLTQQMLHLQHARNQRENNDLFPCLSFLSILI